MATTTSVAEAVKQVFDLMSELKVSLGDLELYGYIENREPASDDEPEEGDLTVTVERAFDALVEAGFNLWDSSYAEHYYQATADLVHEALDQHGLLVPYEGEEG